MSKKQLRRQQREREAQARRDALIARWKARESGEHGGEHPGDRASDAVPLAPRRRRKPRPEYVYLESFNITDEPLHDRHYPRPEEFVQQEEELHDLTYNNPAEAVPRLEALREKYPDVPVIANWLTAAYTLLGEHEKADEVTEETYRRHPNYLFAKCNYAHLLMQQGEPEKVPALFGGNFGMSAIAPNRRLYHVSEVVAFAMTMGRYSLEIGQPKMATGYARILVQVAPDHPNTLQLAARLLATEGIYYEDLFGDEPRK